MARGKRFLVKIYDRNGKEVAIHTDVVISSFDWSLFGGVGELRIKLAKKITDFSEGKEIDFKFMVKVYVFDVDVKSSGWLIYSGYISSYDQIISGSTEYVELVVLGYQTLFSKLLLKSGSDTTVTYSQQDPGAIIKDIVGKAASTITTTSALVDNTGQSLSYTFRNNTIKECLDKIIDLVPFGYFWYTNANNNLVFTKAAFDRIDLSLKLGRDFTDIQVHKSIDDMVNRLFFVGGGTPNLYTKTDRTSSQNEFGVLEATRTDQRVTATDTATQFATSFLDRYDHPQVKVSVIVDDSNLNANTGVNIEKLRPGMIIELRNITDEKNSLWDVANWDVDFWDFNFLGVLANPLVLQKITYRTDSAILELGDFQTTFTRDFIDLKTKLTTVEYSSLPTAPS